MPVFYESDCHGLVCLTLGSVTLSSRFLIERIKQIDLGG